MHSPLFQADFNQNWNVSTNCSKTPQCQFFFKIRSAILELLHADRRTDKQQTNKLIFSTFHCGCPWIGTVRVLEVKLSLCLNTITRGRIYVTDEGDICRHIRELLSEVRRSIRTNKRWNMIWSLTSKLLYPPEGLTYGDSLSVVGWTASKTLAEVTVLLSVQWCGVRPNQNSREKGITNWHQPATQ
jgi:hypothetical protein